MALFYFVNLSVILVGTYFGVGWRVLLMGRQTHVLANDLACFL